MPPKPNPKDIKEIITLVNTIWPEFFMTQEKLLHPTSSFVISFYTNFLNDVNSKLSDLFNKELKFNEVGDTQEYPSEMYLYNKMKLVCRMIFKDAFYLNDIFKPEPLRTVKFIKLLTHFMVYCSNITETALELTANSFKIASEMKQHKEKKQELLRDIGPLAETVGKSSKEYETLIKEHDSWAKSHKKLLETKNEQQKYFNEKKTELKKLEREYEIEQEDLLKLNEEETKLKEMVITEEDMEKLKVRQNQLKAQLEQLYDELKGINETITTQAKELQCASKYDCLSKFNVDDSDLKEYYDCKELLKSIEEDNHKINAELNTLKNEQDGLKTEIEQIQSVLCSEEKHFQKLQINIEKTVSEKNKINENKHKELKEKLKQFQNLQNLIIKYQTDVNEIEQNIEKLNREFKEDYQSMMAAYQQTIEYVFKAFSENKENVRAALN